MSLASQAKLLRVLEQKQFYRLGGQKPVRSTYASLRPPTFTGDDGSAEKFREDLYYRLKWCFSCVRCANGRTHPASEGVFLWNISRPRADAAAADRRSAEVLEPSPGRATSASCATRWATWRTWPGAACSTAPVCPSICPAAHRTRRVPRGGHQNAPGVDTFGRSTRGKRRAAEHWA
jgi:hypothetical protein